MKLYRSSSDKKIAGVCGGLAEYFNIDATIIRVIFILLLLPGGFPGFIPYVIVWLLAPVKTCDRQII
jgi:phage shock protein C